MVIHPFYGSDQMLVLVTYDVNTEDAAGRKRLRKIAKKYSLRFYYLGNKYENKVEHFGAKDTYQPEGTWII